MLTVPTAEPWTYTLELPRDPRAAGIARDTVRAVLDRHGMRELGDTAALLTSELVTNTYVHTAGPASVRLHGDEDATLRVSVWDTSSTVPALFGGTREVVCDQRADSGRGLLLLRRCASTWGSVTPGTASGGKTLWFELARTNRKARRCGECVTLEAARCKAADGADKFRAAVATVAVRTHITLDHLGPVAAR
ncbi:ATP-binding protein [Streptomyces sp. UNOC14_S4]|uniref:ATP-binding protein n=1 Tax=Streptomyces sp. UNOC14_S4 TaxID=2872340 RepID=UPI001E303A07|nr:ATP-binding protein [Streptomyces sp. UNOC14_S4]MCC3766690.1 ATP-binding protein [Streptomyces sp. UNOC14_S4]